MLELLKRKVVVAAKEEFMLSNFFKKIVGEEKKKIENFLALVIGEKETGGCIWEIDEGKVKIKQALVSEENIESLVDKLFSSLAEDYPLPEKVLFGISPFWVEDNKLKKERGIFLKNLCRKLNLKPLGFVNLTESLVYFYRKTEGVPPNLILAGIFDDKINVNLIRAGRIMTAKEEKHDNKTDGNIGIQTAAILSKYEDIEIFPSRIMIYGENDLESVKQELLSYPWTQKFSFLHFPQIEILDTLFMVKAIALAGAGEMGAKLETEEEKIQITDSGELGFVKEEDIVEKSKIKNQKSKIREEILEEKREERELPIEKIEKKRPRIELGNITDKFSGFISKIRLPHFSLPELNLGNFKWWLGGLLIFVFLFGGAFFWLWWNLPKANIRLYVIPRVLEKEVEINIIPEAGGVDIEKKQIPAFLVSADETGAKKTITTGKKTVGDKAKGEVIVYNATDNEKNFPVGTIISTNGLKFTLDNDIVIASSSSMFAEKSLVKVAATAFDIGPEYNLSAGQEFTVENLSKNFYLAKNEAAFSGGTSREINIIAKSDYERLEATLSGELTEKVKNSIASKVESGQKLIEESLKSKILEKKFDKEIGEESSEVKLSMTISFSGLAYRENDLDNLLSSLVRESIPEDYELKSEQTSKEILGIETKKDQTAVIKLKFKADLLPKINTEEISKNLLGKKPKKAEEYLRQIANVSGFDYDFKPRLPKNLQSFPHILKNIKIEIVKE